MGQVTIGGSSLPAVRVELNPNALFNYRIGMEDVRAALAAANANSPKGSIDDGGRRYQIYTNDQAREAADYRSLVIAYRNGAPVRLSDVAEVVDSVEDVRNQGLANGRPSVLVIIYRQPNANIIETVDRVRAALPQLRPAMPSDIDLEVANERTATIRASLRAVEVTLVIAILLVVGVVLLFLRDPRAALIPAVAVPVSLIGTFGAMYLLGFSLNNLSLMALTIATGFVVDDAVVVLENISRHIEAGHVAASGGPARRARGRVHRAVDEPVAGRGVPADPADGRHHRPAVPRVRDDDLDRHPDLAGAVADDDADDVRPPAARATGAAAQRLLQGMGPRLRGADGVLCAHPGLGARPSPDGGADPAGGGRPQRLPVRHPAEGLLPAAGYRADVRRHPRRPEHLVPGDAQEARAVRRHHQEPIRPSTPWSGFTGGGQTNAGFVFIALKPRAERGVSAEQVIERLRPQVAQVAGATLGLQTVQDIRAGGRPGNAQFQYTLQGDNLDELRLWAPRLAEALRSAPELTDVDADQDDNGLETMLDIDRATASRLGLTMSQITSTLYDAFGQRQVSTIYDPLNQYHVVMEVAPPYRQSPDALDKLYVSSTGGSVRGSQATNAVAGTVSHRRREPRTDRRRRQRRRRSQAMRRAISGRTSSAPPAAAASPRAPR